MTYNRICPDCNSRYTRGILTPDIEVDVCTPCVDKRKLKREEPTKTPRRVTIKERVAKCYQVRKRKRK